MNLPINETIVVMSLFILPESKMCIFIVSANVYNIHFVVPFVYFVNIPYSREFHSRVSGERNVYGNMRDSAPPHAINNNTILLI